MSRRRELKMKDVGLEHLEQYNQLLRYVFQVTDKELQEIGWEEKEIIRAKSPTLEQADVKGWFDGDKLISQVAVYPMKVRIFNKTYNMGGLTGVGTYPEYSNQGLMHKLLYQSLKNMKEKKQSISFLYPKYTIIIFKLPLHFRKVDQYEGYLSYNFVILSFYIFLLLKVKKWLKVYRKLLAIFHYLI